VNESPAEIANLVFVYRAMLDGSMTADLALMRLRSEMGYGVVRGSLRIL
jgi:hypothetical protein